MRPLALLALLLALAGVAMASGPATGARSLALGAHPRIFLDQPEMAGLLSQVKAGSTAWKAVQGRCDDFLKGTVEWPDGDDYPDSDSIGEGYQGDGYLPPLMELGICYQMTVKSDKATAAAYAAKGEDVLTKMTAPTGPHAVAPLRDDGYGIRFYVVGMAIGFDWFYPALSATLKSRIITAMHRWIDAFKSGGFENDFPMGNYYAGYYDATALAAIATEGSDPKANWGTWVKRIQNGFVQPYYAANLSGGGWPEGWNYGPFGVLNMSWPSLAAMTGARTNLVDAPGHRFTFPLNTAKFLLFFTWPNLLTQEDSDFTYDSDNPSPTHTWLVAFESALLREFHDPFAPAFQSYAEAVRKVQAPGDEGQDWENDINFLFWEPNAPAKRYQSLPLSYVAHGIEMASTRSSWAPNAVWAEFKAGPYTAYTENGEELEDQGSAAIVNGNKPFLVNAWSALVRDTPGTNDGSPLWNLAYNDVLGDDSSRDLFNVFYLSTPDPPGQGDHARSDGARTEIDRFQDGGSFVDMRGVHLADNYPRDDGEPKAVTSWTREIVFVRPRVFVVFDRTTVTSAAGGERMDFHFGGALTPEAPGQYEVGSGAAYSGTVTSVLPAGAQDSVVDVFNSNKVYRLEVAPSPPTLNTNWLTVLDAAASPAMQSSVTPLSPTAGAMGVVVAGSGVRAAVIQSPGAVSYSLPSNDKTENIVVGLSTKTGYSVQITPGSSGPSVTITPGAGRKTSAAGVLVFSTS
jgi:hypothetical protein